MDDDDCAADSQFIVECRQATAFVRGECDLVIWWYLNGSFGFSVFDLLWPSVSLLVIFLQILISPALRPSFYRIFLSPPCSNAG